MSTADIIRTALLPHAQAPIPEDDNASLFDSGVIDSFALADVITELERVLGVTVPDAELTPKHFATVAKMVGYFEARRG